MRWKESSNETNEEEKNEEGSYFLSLVGLEKNIWGKKKPSSKLFSFVWKIENELSKENYILLGAKYNCQVTL